MNDEFLILNIREYLKQGESGEKIPPVRFRLTSLTAGHFPTTEYIIYKVIVYCL